jgi:hypothetical protein
MLQYIALRKGEYKTSILSYVKEKENYLCITNSEYSSLLAKNKIIVIVSNTKPFIKAIEKCIRSSTKTILMWFNQFKKKWSQRILGR